MKKVPLINKIFTGGSTLLQKASIFTSKTKDLFELCEAFSYITPESKSVNPYFPKEPLKSSLPELLLAVIGFDHKKGSVIEHVHPELCKSFLLEKGEFADFFNKLCFAAIPDAAHFLEDDYAFIMLRHNDSILYGVTCFRQVGAGNIPSEEANSSRQCIQKAVCILSQAPLFTLMLNRLHPTTHAYFNQCNFADRSILLDLYGSVMGAINSNLDYGEILLGLPLKQLIYTLKEKVFVLLKLILLERKIVIYSRTASVVTTFILSLCSLIPGLLTFSGSCISSTKLRAYLKSQEMYGLPLQVFSKDILLMPLFTLNDIGMLKDMKGYTIGTTNLLLFQMDKLKADAYYDIDKKELKVRCKELKEKLKPTEYEAKFIKKMLKNIKAAKGNDQMEMNWSCCGNRGENGIEAFMGGNDFIRKKFARYFQKFLVNLSVVKAVYQDLKDAEDSKECVSPPRKTTNMLKLKAMCDKIKEKEHNKVVGKENEEENKIRSGVEILTLDEGMPRPKEESLHPKELEELKKEHQIEKEKIIQKLIERYNFSWLTLWQGTSNFQVWRRVHSPTLFCLSKFFDIVTTSTVYYENGDIYSGEICRGKRYGTGTLAFDNGNGLYEGDWRDDKRQGYGNQVTSLGKYSGQFADDVFNGTGKLEEVNGRVYEGEWVQGTKTGLARIKFPTGEVYVGEVRNGKLEGKGQFTSVDGEIYDGEFKDGLRHGKGQIIKPDGEVIMCEWDMGTLKEDTQ